jgi:hypothetical protein
LFFFSFKCRLVSLSTCKRDDTRAEHNQEEGESHEDPS